MKEHRASAWLAGVVLFAASCGGSTEDTSPTSGTSPISTEPPAIVTTAVTTVATTPLSSPGTATTAPLETTSGTHHGFIVGVDTTGSQAGVVVYDRIEVTEASWDPGNLDLEAMTNENSLQRSVAAADGLAVTLLCDTQMSLGPSGCTDGSAYSGTLDDVARALQSVPYTWAAARSGIRARAALPPVFDLTVGDGGLTTLTQRTAFPFTVLGWSPDLGPWMHPAIEPCCGELGVGTPSLPLPAAGQPLPQTLYAVDFGRSDTSDAHMWSPDRPDVIDVVLRPWIPAACVSDGTCEKNAIEIDYTQSLAYRVVLDDSLVVHVGGFECLAAAEGFSSDQYFASGTAFARLLSQGTADVRQWEALLSQLSYEHAANADLAAQLASSPFEPSPCGDNPVGLAVYEYDTTGIGLLIQGSPTTFFLDPLIGGLGVDEDGNVHLFWWAGFRS